MKLETVLKDGLSNCKTDKHVLALLKKYDLPIKENKTKESSYFNIWLDSQTRIYKSGKVYKLQKWNKHESTGIEKRIIPTCYGYTKEIESHITIDTGYNGILDREVI